MSDGYEEVRVGDKIISFDGRVLELFGYGNVARRIHVATIEKLETSDGRFTGSMLQIEVRGETDTNFGLKGDEAQRAELDGLLAKVNAARSTAEGG